MQYYSLASQQGAATFHYQMNEDLDSGIVEGLGENDDDDEEEEEESDSSDEFYDSSVELDLDGEEGGEDAYDILGFAAF
jgi:hypothetical protein